MEDNKRVFGLLIFFIILFVIVIVRLIDLQLVHYSFYSNKSANQRKRIIDLAARRGDVFDRNGHILATSLDSYSAYKYDFGWLARKQSLSQAEEIKKSAPTKIGLIKEKKRIYPKNYLAAQVIGFVGIDNQGLSGIELSLDEYLKGKKGQVITEGDRSGVEMYGSLSELDPGLDGMNVTLTIDENIQYIAEREVTQQIKEFQANSGVCIVMNAKTGEILALASKPDFDPNNYQKSKKENWHPRFVNPFEPGSTFKAITVAAALEEGLINPETKLRALDSIVVGGKVITNAHDIDWTGRFITVRRMLDESINTGSVQVGQKLGAETFYKYIKAFGFGEKTGFGLWGESRGILRHFSNWYKPDIGMITFGQSIATTPLQLLSAFSVFTNKGQRISPYIIKKIEKLDGQFIKSFARTEKGRVLSEKVTKQMRDLLESTVENGSGQTAKIKGFSVCGKTGTAQKTSQGGRGYLKDRYISSFIGFSPKDDPAIICLVIIDDPKGKFWGSTVAAPVFKRVVEYTLRYLNVKPDMI